MKFDLTKYNIYLKGNFVAAIEFIPTGIKNNPIYYEVKLGGSAKSFVRQNSQGEWSVPPLHYKLFITALVPDKKDKFRENNSEEGINSFHHVILKISRGFFFRFRAFAR